MQLKWQVAASSCYADWKEMCGVTGSGANTAAQSPSPERTSSTSGGLNWVFLQMEDLISLLVNLQVNRKVQTEEQWGFGLHRAHTSDCEGQLEPVE